MKIEWIDGTKEVPGIGLLSEGDKRDVPEDIGRSLIKQKQARLVTPEKEKKIKKSKDKTEVTE